MSIRDYLHEKAEESRHNEMSAYLMFIAGAIFYVGGILETIITTQTPDWFLFFPYKFTPDPGSSIPPPGSILGMSLMICGVALLVFGLGAGVFYSRDRVWYIQELYKTNSMEADTMGTKKRKRKDNINKTLVS